MKNVAALADASRIAIDSYLRATSDIDTPPESLKALLVATVSMLSRVTGLKPSDVVVDLVDVLRQLERSMLQ